MSRSVVAIKISEAAEENNSEVNFGLSFRFWRSKSGTQPTTARTILLSMNESRQGKA
jgi:hypothetical protein